VRRTVLLALLLGLTSCNMDLTGGAGNNNRSEAPDRQLSDPHRDPLSSIDPPAGKAAKVVIPDAEARPVMQMQVVLDRLGFTPGVVDGTVDTSTRNALSGFQEANELAVTGQLDTVTKQALARWDNIPATRVVTIPADLVNEPFMKVPDSPEAQAKLERLGYTSLDEKLAERFHTTIETLKLLNPEGRPAGMERAKAPSHSPTSKQSDQDAASSYFRAGQIIRVPNIGADRIVAASVKDSAWLATLQSLGVGSEQPKASRIVVSKSGGTLKVYNREDKLVGMYTATMGSRRDPLPLGNWKVLAVAHNPHFAFDPTLFWDVPDSEAKQTLPPGPNGPVGVVWIDLSKEHYGIHGTPEPETIGRAQSHGCVRLTNWDAARLAQMVSTGTKVVFEA
jgi:lipoprotein-anchoring transpeptidase ErfK/SrfK